MLPIIRIKIAIKIIFIIDKFLLHTDLFRSNDLHFKKVSSVSYEQIRVALFLHTDLSLTTFYILFALTIKATIIAAITATAIPPAIAGTMAKDLGDVIKVPTV